MPKLCPVSPALLPQYAPGAEAAAALLPSFFRFHMALALARNETVIKQTGRAVLDHTTRCTLRRWLLGESRLLLHRLSPQGFLALQLTIGLLATGTSSRYGAGRGL